jgi:hypothetical protein
VNEAICTPAPYKAKKVCLKTVWSCPFDDLNDDIAALPRDPHWQHLAQQRHERAGFLLRLCDESTATGGFGRFCKDSG